MYVDVFLLVHLSVFECFDRFNLVCFILMKGASVLYNRVITSVNKVDLEYFTLLRLCYQYYIYIYI